MSFLPGVFPSKKITARIKRIIVAVILLIAAVVGIVNDYKAFVRAQNAVAEASGLFSVHYIDVGQGDSTLVCSPSGKFMLIDCGPTLNSSYLIKYLWDMGVEKIDCILITHPHDDHYGGITEVMENFDVEEIILHKDLTDVYPYDKFIDMAEDYGTEIVLTEKGDCFEFDGCADFEILSPAYVDEDDLNETSLCFRLKFEDTAFMFTGDAEKPSEHNILRLGKDIKADVIKAGHHGSSTSNTKAFIEAVNPAYAVVSCGKNNEYGHPHKEVVKLFEEMGIEMLVTHETGGVVFVSDGTEITYVEDFFARSEEIHDDAKSKERSLFFEYICSWF